MMLAAYNTPVHGAVWVGAVLHAVIMVYGWFYMLLHVYCMGMVGVEWLDGLLGCVIVAIAW